MSVMPADMPHQNPAEMPHRNGVADFTAKLPGDTAAVSAYLKRSVYDPTGEKIGDVTDLIMGIDGKISTALISRGGFLGIGEKQVAVSFGSLQVKRHESHWFLVMDATWDDLKNRDQRE
jgi:sporulation protein YlmC with PRC-barrel domain